VDVAGFGISGFFVSAIGGGTALEAALCSFLPCGGPVCAAPGLGGGGGGRAELPCGGGFGGAGRFAGTGGFGGLVGFGGGGACAAGRPGGLGGGATFDPAFIGFGEWLAPGCFGGGGAATEVGGGFGGGGRADGINPFFELIKDDDSGMLPSERAGGFGGGGGFSSTFGVEVVDKALFCFFDGRTSSDESSISSLFGDVLEGDFITNTASPSSTESKEESCGGDAIESVKPRSIEGACDMNLSGIIESALFSLYGFPKFTIRRDLTRACTLSWNSPVTGSKKAMGRASSSTDHFGDPSTAVVDATPAKSFDP